MKHIFDYFCIVKLLNSNQKAKYMKYFLRPGDFRPEEATEPNLRLVFGQNATLSYCLEQLNENNNLFHNLDHALQASYWVRQLLTSLNHRQSFRVEKLCIRYVDK